MPVVKYVFVYSLSRAHNILRGLVRWYSVSSSHIITWSGTSPDSSGTGYRPRSSETDCALGRADNVNRWHTQTVCLEASMLSCERRCRSCSGHGVTPFHKYLEEILKMLEAPMSCSRSVNKTVCTCGRLTHSAERQSDHQALQGAVVGTKTSTWSLAH